MNRLMRNLIRLLERLINHANRPSADERYLAQSADAQEFEVRMQTVEHRRP